MATNRTEATKEKSGNKEYYFEISDELFHSFEAVALIEKLNVNGAIQSKLAETMRDMHVLPENQILKTKVTVPKEEKTSATIQVTMKEDCAAALETIADVMQIPVEVLLSDVLKKPLRSLQHEPDGEGIYRFIDLFAGIGGMRIAYENAGCHCVYTSEWNKNARKTYYINFGVLPYGDITKVDASKDIPNHDILVAGFPCQPFSIAGVSKKNSLGRATGFEDKTQGTLFFDVCRILKAKRPKAFMLENVKNLCSHDKGNTFRVIRESLEELNYEVFYQVIDGQNFVPQHRERIIIVGFDRERYGSDVEFEFKLTPPDRKPVINDILEPQVDTKYTLTDNLWNYLQNYAEKHKAAGNGFGYGIAPHDGIARTLSARYYKDGSEILLEQPGMNPRRLTPRECARLQGFPDSFEITVADTEAYRQFGNSVVVPLMENVAELVVSKLKDLDGMEK